MALLGVLWATMKTQATSPNVAPGSPTPARTEFLIAKSFHIGVALPSHGDKPADAPEGSLERSLTQFRREGASGRPARQHRTMRPKSPSNAQSSPLVNLDRNAALKFHPIK